MKIGQSREMVTEAGGTGFPEQIQLNEGRNVHRIVYGPKRVERIWWPTLTVEDGKQRQAMRVINRPTDGCVLDTLAALEKEAWRALGDEDPSSQFSHIVQFLYLAIDLNVTPYTVKIAPYKWTVFQRLVQIQEAIHDKNPDFLMYGLIWMYPVIITKTVDPRKGMRYGTSYSVDPHPENPWIGKIPASWLRKSFEEIAAEVEEGSKDAKEKNTVNSLFYSEEEWEAIEACTIDLDRYSKANTQEEIIAKLKENPIYLGAVDKNNRKPIFPENLKQFIQSSGVPIIEESKQTTFLNATPKKLPKEVPVEAEHEVVNPKENSIEKPEEKKTKESAKRPKWAL